jgi:hypothetical protein
MAASTAVGREALMGTKDKGGRSSKKAAAKGLKEKRLDKKAKRAAHANTANQSVDKTFRH